MPKKRPRKIAKSARPGPSPAKPRRKRGHATTRRGTWKDAFLSHLARSGNVTESAAAAGVDRKTAQTHHKEDKAFAADWDDAMERAADVIKAELFRRAVEGVDKPVIHQGTLCYTAIDKDGKPVYSGSPEALTEVVKGEDGKPKTVPKLVPFTVKEYSDGLLQFLAKSARPREFRDNLHHTSDGSFKADDQVVLVHSAPPAPEPPADGGE